MRNNASNESDEEIIDRVIQGDADAFEFLLERYRNNVFAILGRRVPGKDVEEVAHEAFVRAYSSLAAYERRGEFSAWLSKIAVRAGYDYWRERYRRREQPMSSLGDGQLKWVERFAADQSIRTHGDEMSMHEAREMLAWAMERLSAEDRAVLELVHLEERPVKEAAGLLGWSVVNVKVRAYRARKRLRAILERLIAERRETS